MRDSSTVSAFAARKTTAVKETPIVPEDVVPRLVPPELLEQLQSVEEDELSSSSASEDGNQFSVLNSSGNAPTLAPKRIFEEGDDAVRVEVGEGQSIAILGICNIWVKAGEVAVLGARLPASPVLHRIYAPATGALPQITALREKTDFVLSSTGDDLLDLYANTNSPIWDVPGPMTASERSFYILGYSFTYDEVTRKRLKVLDLTKWRSITAIITKPLAEGRSVLVCGSASTGKSTFCRASINRFLADQPLSRESVFQNLGVLLLDLDLARPELTPPGLIYLAHIKITLLGPPESHLAIPEFNQNRILRMHYLGGMHADNMSNAGTIAVQDLLQYLANARKSYPGCPIVINSSSWLLEMDPAQLSMLVSIMQLSDIVYFDGSGSLRYRELFSRSMGDKCSLWGLASKVYRSASASMVQWTYMQSYFHRVASKLVEPRWDRLALISSNRHELAYGGPQALISAICTLGERLEPDNVAQALENSMVAFVAIAAEKGWKTKADYPLDELPRPFPSHIDPTTPEILDEQDEQEEQAPAIVWTEAENLPYVRNLNLEATILHPQRSECLGLAYINGIDPVREVIDILTPVSQQTMSIRRDNGYDIAIVMGRQEHHWAPTHGWRCQSPADPASKKSTMCRYQMQMGPVLIGARPS